MPKFHSPDCENAETHRCRCWCGGEFHGIHTGVYATVNGVIVKPVDGLKDEKIMSKVDGGEVETQILDLEGKQFKCIGVCQQPLMATPLWGYPHDGGYEDATGLKWWLYVKCPRCNYATSVWKIPQNLIQEATV